MKLEKLVCRYCGRTYEALKNSVLIICGHCHNTKPKRKKS